MPLRALLNGEYYWAHELTEDDRGVDFKCPICREKFIIVIPRKNIIKHFRHKSGKEHWEPETIEHLKAKITVYNEANVLGWKPNLEVMVLNQHIADVFLNKGKINIAVECQCSNVSLDDFLRKDSFYLSHGIYPLWIWGGKYFEHTKKFLLWEKAVREFDYTDDFNHDHYETIGYKAYRIQKIKKLEQLFLNKNRSLYYFGNNSFFIGDFQYRWNANILGWYKLYRITLSQIFEREMERINNAISC